MFVTFYSWTALKNLTLTLEEEITILNKYRLIPAELLLIRTLLILQDEDNEELFFNYVKSLKQSGVNLRDLLVSLQDKEILLKSCKIVKKGEEFDPYALQFNKNFIKNLYKCSFELGKELFEEYPQFGSINGNIIPLRGVSKHFDSLEQAYFKYGKAIKWNPERHNEIIELTKWAKENNIINCSLSSFIINNSWLDLKSMKEGNVNNINYDTIREL